MRGFKEETLGPPNVFGDPAGGNALLVFNEELRFPIIWRFRGVGFIDAGNAFATIRDLGLRGLRAGAGVGLRVDAGQHENQGESGGSRERASDPVFHGGDYASCSC